MLNDCILLLINSQNAKSHFWSDCSSFHSVANMNNSITGTYGWLTSECESKKKKIVPKKEIRHHETATNISFRNTRIE